MLIDARPSRREATVGYSMVELLVVVAVLGIIALISIPIYMSQKTKTQIAAAQMTVSDLGRAIVTGQSSLNSTISASNQYISINTGPGTDITVPITPGSGVRIMIDPDGVGSSAPLNGTSIVAGTPLSMATWCVSADVPNGSVVSMRSTDSVVNTSGTACYSGQSLSDGAIIAAAPDAPTGVSAIAGATQAVVSWTAPVGTGGSAVTGYTVTSSPDAKTCTTTGALTCTVSTLTNGTSYTFTVTATNAVGTGSPSVASASVTPVAAPTAPNAPTGVAAVAAPTSAVVSWMAPASNGGSAVTGYTVTSSPGSKTCTTTGALFCTVTGLTNGMGYTFTVTATNIIGTSSASTSSASVTPGALAFSSGYTNQSVDVGVAVTTRTPTLNNATFVPVVFTVSPALPAGVNVNSSTGAFSGTPSVASPLTTYTVTATDAALNAVTTTFTLTVTTVAPTVPATPTNVTVTYSGGVYATIDWTVPSTGGSPITMYELQSSSNGGASWAGLNGQIISGSPTAQITPAYGIATMYRVRVKNSTGWSIYSAASNSVTALTLPRITGTGRTVAGMGWDVKFSATVDTGGAAITQYQYEIGWYEQGTIVTTASPNGTPPNPVAAWTVEGDGGSTDGTYCFRMRAKNSLGWGSWSATQANMSDWNCAAISDFY